MFILDLQLHATDGQRVEPVHRNNVLINDRGRNPMQLKQAFGYMRLITFPKSSYCFHQ